MKRGQKLDPPPVPAAIQALQPGAGIFYRHDAGAPEIEISGAALNGYQGTFEWALWQVDSRRGGYVVERDAAGKVVRRHPR